MYAIAFVASLVAAAWLGFEVRAWNSDRSKRPVRMVAAAIALFVASSVAGADNAGVSLAMRALGLGAMFAAVAGGWVVRGLIAGRSDS
ncbi:hypothetical protein [Rarobacter incanus]|uniref:Uncharacterized protein n=1 Tax=Rarobacter incanus TaxID=153494 RepID=A0A542SQB9_9MICO|nr:hypothetical protein [Rarobacter incanus]TQK76806.1 hypothetical protein FB389_1497 [Rarobacter incanus]